MKHYIDCPFEEKDQAKKLGARWDPAVRRWYYTDREDAALFKRWEPDASTKEVALTDVIKAHRSVCWYPSAGSDFRAIFHLSDQYVKSPKAVLPDLFIMTDYHAGEMKHYGDPTVSYSDIGFNRMESGHLKAGDLLFRDAVTELKIASITPIKKLDIGVEKSVITFGVSQKYASGYLMHLEMHTKITNTPQRCTIEADVVYLYAENTAFARDFLLKNKLSVDWILRIRYGNGFGGSKAKGMWLDYLAQPLGVRYLISDTAYRSPAAMEETDTRMLRLIEKNIGKKLTYPKLALFHSMEWYKEQFVCWYALNGSPLLFDDAVTEAKPPTPAPAAKPEPDEDDDWLMDEEYDDTSLPLYALVHNTNLLKKQLTDTIVGQEPAVQAFCDALFDAQVLLQQDEKRKKPVIIFTFAGPPGVGKSLLAQKAAEQLQKPWLLLNMSSYSDKEGVNTLTGFDYSYRKATPGELTQFVFQHPDSVLIFDEIEKASSDVLRLFLQILEGGELEDKYYNGLMNADPDEEGNPMSSDVKKLREELIKRGSAKVSFRQTIVIFTTNAGRSLYENGTTEKLSALPVKSIIDAIRTDVDPLTGRLLFPSELISRITSGKLLMFDHLSPKYLLQIADQNFEKLRDAFRKKYAIELTKDQEGRFLTSLLFSLGGRTDARAIAAKSESFIKEKVRDVVMAAENTEIRDIHFSVEKNTSPDVERLFCSPAKANILVYASREVISRLQANFRSRFTFLCADHVEEAVVLAVKNSIDLALIDMEHNSLLSELDESKTILATVGARKLREGVRLMKELTEKFPDLPIYTLQTGTADKYSEQLNRQFMAQGVRGSLALSDASFEDELASICSETYMQASAHALALRSKQLTFDSAVQYDQETGIHTVELRNLTLNNAPSAEDMQSLVKAAERPSDRFADIIGNKRAKKELLHLCEYLKNPVQFTAMGYPRPSGVLLYGAPGTGKTMLARATAGESDVAFIQTQGSILLEQGIKGVRDLFARARRNAPAIIFIDEIDSIGKQRTGSGAFSEVVLNTLLAEMDGFSVDNKRPVVVIAATNADVEANMGIATLDEALARRFSKTIRIQYLGLQDRAALIRLLAGRYLPDESSISQFAEMTEGLSSADIKKIVNDALQTSIAEKKPFDFDTALQNVLFGHPDAEHAPTPEELHGIALHEAGHAIIYLTTGFVPSYITIQSRSDFGGYMSHSIEDLNRYSLTRADYLGMIRCALGGRAAEELMLGGKEAVTSGAASDLAKATKTAARMILFYGYDDEYGLVNFGRNTPAHSVGGRIRPLLQEEYQKAIDTLTQHKAQLLRLTDALLQQKCLFRSQIEKLLPEMIGGTDGNQAR